VRTNIDIDEDLMRQALEFGRLPTKKATVEAALRVFIAMNAQEDIRQLLGKVEFWDDYDYKAMRESH